MSKIRHCMVCCLRSAAWCTRLWQSLRSTLVQRRLGLVRIGPRFDRSGFLKGSVTFTCAGFVRTGVR